MSLLMDALKKAEQAKQGEVGKDAPSRPAAPVESVNQLEREKAAMPAQHVEDTFSLELTLDEAEAHSRPGLVDTALTLDEPVPQVQVESESDDLSLSADSSGSAVELHKMAQEPGPVSEPLHSTTGTGSGSTSGREPVVAEENPATVHKEMPTPDPQQLQRTFLLKSRAADRRKRLLLLSLGSVALLSLLGGGYYYFEKAISNLGSTSLVASDNVENIAPVQDIAESAEAVADEPGLPASSTPAAQVDSGVPAIQVLAPLQQSILEEQTASVKQSIQAPVSRSPAQDNNTGTPVHKPKVAVRSEPAPARPVKAGRIRIVRAHKTDPFNQRLLEAYHAYQAGNYTLAARNYHEVLKQDATNRDALLGLAAIAHRNGDREQAADYYITLLKHDPRDSTAISGLMTLHGAGLTVENESRIKILLNQEPEAAHLHFVLGTLYAGQSRWADAQQSFFNAHRYAPQNADYAYNLAVSLDRMSKQTAALEYYRRAVRLAGEQRAMFNLSEANERIKALVGLTDPIR